MATSLLHRSSLKIRTRSAKPRLVWLMESINTDQTFPENYQKLQMESIGTLNFEASPFWISMTPCLLCLALCWSFMLKVCAKLHHWGEACRRASWKGSGATGNGVLRCVDCAAEGRSLELRNPPTAEILTGLSSWWNAGSWVKSFAFLKFKDTYRIIQVLFAVHFKFTLRHLFGYDMYKRKKKQYCRRSCSSSDFEQNPCLVSRADWDSKEVKKKKKKKIEVLSRQLDLWCSAEFQAFSWYDVILGQPNAARNDTGDALFSPAISCHPEFKQSDEGSKASHTFIPHFSGGWHFCGKSESALTPCINESVSFLLL